VSQLSLSMIVAGIAVPMGERVYLIQSVHLFSNVLIMEADLSCFLTRESRALSGILSSACFMHATLILATYFDMSDPIESSIGLCQIDPACDKGLAVLSFLQVDITLPHWQLCGRGP